MANAVYDIRTSLNPEQLSAVAAETFRQWLQFALGKTEIGGKTLAHPSGRYAASISWRRTGVASVAIIADENIAPEAGAIEEGRSAADMKEAMLSGGKVAKAGYRYRVIPIRKDFDKSTLKEVSITATSSGERVKPGQARVWAKPRPAVNASHFVTMTDKPGSSSWKIPAFKAYAPAKIMSDLLREQYGSLS